MYRDDIHANMVSTFATEVDCSIIEDLSVMNINGEYVMAFICENQSGNTTLMFRSIMVEQIKLGNTMLENWLSVGHHSNGLLLS